MIKEYTKYVTLDKPVGKNANGPVKCDPHKFSFDISVRTSPRPHFPKLIIRPINKSCLTSFIIKKNFAKDLKLHLQLYKSSGEADQPSQNMQKHDF